MSQLRRGPVLRVHSRILEARRYWMHTAASCDVKYVPPVRHMSQRRADSQLSLNWFLRKGALMVAARRNYSSRHVCHLRMMGVTRFACILPALAMCMGCLVVVIIVSSQSRADVVIMICLVAFCAIYDAWPV